MNDHAATVLAIARADHAGDVGGWVAVLKTMPVDELRNTLVLACIHLDPNSAPYRNLEAMAASPIAPPPTPDPAA